MNTLALAFRNIFRNGRRSAMTVAAIAVGAVAILLFGGFVASVILGFQTFIITGSGHLHVYKKGYFDYGAGNPSAYGIDKYREVMAGIADDPDLKPMITMMTPTLTLYGIAGNFGAGVSKTFFGTGLIPSDREKMRQWNDYNFPDMVFRRTAFSDGETQTGIIGTGLARMLLLCEPLHVPNCPSAPKAATGDGPIDSQIADLADLEKPSGDVKPGEVRIDLLAATANGAPNVVSMTVAEAVNQGIKEIDDAYVAMHLDLAQRLVFGRGEKKATTIQIQLNHTRDIPAARARLMALFADKGLDLEVRDFAELTPMYPQVIGMFGTIFTFISLIMGTIVLFTIVNTMGMSVMERINEIGTVRALGLRRSGVRRLFLAEGFLLGLIGATVGVAAAVLFAQLINRSGMSWTPPGNAAPIPLSILIFQAGKLLPATWIGLTVLATLSAFIPANKAARMVIVDALRHV